ncbi:hypothetical protein Drorol1_Dr00009306 [Drosera rotundifolia]
MTSKGPRSKLDHDSRARRQKAFEAPREPRRPKTHWDHVIEEMIWLSKDFEAERKWKLAQAKKVALRASKGMLDPATREEKKMKEEEQRLRKIALSISKDVKKFWTKIEKLVMYKHQLELDDKKKKAMDKQLEYLLGQTERYSTMLAENLLGAPDPCEPTRQCTREEMLSAQQDKSSNIPHRESLPDGGSGNAEIDDEYSIESEDEVEDDEHTIEADEALITQEERREELEALQYEIDLPLEELLKRFSSNEANGESSQGKSDFAEKASREDEHVTDQLETPADGHIQSGSSQTFINGCGVKGGLLSKLESCSSEEEPYKPESWTEGSPRLDNKNSDYEFEEEQEDDEFIIAAGDDRDDEATLDEEEELEKVQCSNPVDEIGLLQRESEVPLDAILERYRKDSAAASSMDESQYSSPYSDTSYDQEPEEDDDGSSANSVGAEDEPNDVDEDDSYKLLLVSPSDEQEVPSLTVDSGDGIERENRIADAAAAARSAQPTGNTFSTTKVRTKFPFLLKYPLREYQHIGLDWLVTMYEKRLNGILADEMGLGKTIMTIALLAHLACEKGIWGPHLIVVPTSVMLNWETEFLKWCPAFKILTYFGSAKERKLKRQGWMKPNSFHVCITTYRLVIQDSKAFKRKKWKYLILDEAHLIKNWKSQRWQTLLNFNSKRRILLTGTPLQNDLMELWSLMHFLMPHIFQSHQEFKDWFSNPISGMVEGQEKVNKEVVDRLHNVLRPFILRRLKRDVEKQLPMKHEHVIYCRLSKRQRNLYEDFIASSETQATLASTNFFGMLNVIMQLRKVCNHPDLFEGRPIVSSFDMAGIHMQLSSAVCSMLSSGPFSSVNLSSLGLTFTFLDFEKTSWESDATQSLAVPSRLMEERVNISSLEDICPQFRQPRQSCGTSIFEDIRKAILEERLKEARERAADIAWWNALRCRKRPLYSRTLRDLLTVGNPLYDIQLHKSNPVSYEYSSKIANVVLSPVEQLQKMIDLVESFMFAIPAARAPPPFCWCSKIATVFVNQRYKEQCSELMLPLLTPIRPAIVRRQLYFPDRRLIQFDCGKLQQLAILLRQLKSEGHRALIFTQMTKMLDILEAFINLYGYTYMRLDGSTQPEERQTLMQRFNTNPKIFLFILSTRSGGVGINLVGADTVIFYDSDWNPAMDQQAQDRCHRIGQTREVHIYRLISESTIEENILKKANQKRVLDNLVIQSGGYNTEFFKKLDPIELFSGHRVLPSENLQKEESADNGVEVSVSNADLEAALKNAEDEADYMALKKVEEEVAVDNQEFTEEVTGRSEDDDLANEDDWRMDESADPNGLVITSNKESLTPSNGNDHEQEKSLSLDCNEDDVDMIADVKQMAAAAAAAGDAVSSFENQLRPIDRYAIRFLELWDPIIDKNAVDTQVQFEETEWQLERIEKLKEDMEAEIDDDEEPFVYESWDTDFATQAYRQQVEALAQHQQLMEELENRAKEEEDAKLDFTMDDEFANARPKPKKKKKTKKTKFKSLKKGSLVSTSIPAEEKTMEPMTLNHHFVTEVPRKSLHKKRKKDESTSDSEEEKDLEVKPKKAKKKSIVQFSPSPASHISHKKHEESRNIMLSEGRAIDMDPKLSSKGKVEGRISISTMPVKRVLMLRPEKLKKKGNIWSSDYIPSPDPWSPSEDAVLCALVHEYDTNWRLVSDTLYGMTAGGSFRGRFRHPVNCAERFRELCQKYILSAGDSLNAEKVSSAVPAKTLLKVTEDHIHTLLDVAMELPDRELLLQKHFTALLSSAWRVQQRNALVSRGDGVGANRLFGTMLYPTTQNGARGKSEKFKFTNLHNCRKSLRTALDDADSERSRGLATMSIQKNVATPTVERLDLTLEVGEGTDGVTLPSTITLSIPGSVSSPPVNLPSEENQLRHTQQVAENSFRVATAASLDGSLSWATSAFRVISDLKSRSVSRSTVLGKHKLSSAETNKASKSKSRKIGSECSDTPLLYGELSPSVFPGIVELPSDPLPPVFPTGVVLESPFDEIMRGLDEESSSELTSFLPHSNESGLISGLEDLTLLPEYTDIG